MALACYDVKQYGLIRWSISAKARIKAGTWIILEIWQVLDMEIVLYFFLC